MKTKIKASWIIIAAIVVLGFMSISSYNGMVKLDQGVKGQWAKVESSYQRRADLIPNLVNTVKGYAEHEKGVFTEITEARASVGKITIDANNLTPESLKEFQKAQAGLSGALGKLLMVQERYPDLKANANFMELQAQLEGTENRINTERNRFNDATKVFNNKILTFPNNILAGLFGFDEKGYFEAAQGSENAPTVEF